MTSRSDPTTPTMPEHPEGRAPVRLQLSRRKGFNLQVHSREVNGLPAVNVARPHRWGNPWKIGGNVYDADRHKFRVCETIEDCIYGFRQSVDWDPDAVWWDRTDENGNRMTAWGGYGPKHKNRKTIQAELRGRNLACWCPLGSPCHADVLLELANGRAALSANDGGGR